MSTPEETRERIVRLEERSITAANDRVGMTTNITEMRKDVVALAVGQKSLDIKFDNMEDKQDAYVVKLDAHFDDLRKANGKGRKIDASIIGAIVAVILGVIAGLAKMFGWL